ncbi:hypothetical protein DBR11_06210 [Pedobacter sp. HMWF019]|uniref:non-ribosomal peptide synthetase n=1 Tax=Pedobacter sp. HMWF019 TaxID=2056856 RepID=UPI000D350548|nr:amino acid adenylation domain-containing protein [Pedobacter sp. HMWF019]PTT01916.1 hypothetical protein DBR11_06210 [Pedobacter sp. HMWF019]
MLSHPVPSDHKNEQDTNGLSQNDIQLIKRFNDTAAPYPKEKMLHMLLEAQALQHPDHTALEFREASLSYKELNESANQLARHLIQLGLKHGENAGILAARGFKMIIAMFAILKAGGSYVPVDPEYPAERQQYILSNSAVKLLIADEVCTAQTHLSGIQMVHLQNTLLLPYDTGNLNLPADGHQMAYTIYTSGSTGTPKGVMIQHCSAVNLITWVNTRFNIDRHDRLLFVTSMCFDLSVYDIFGILAAGGTLVIAGQTQINDITALQLMLQDHRITFWDSVPSTLDYLVKDLELNHRSYTQSTLRIIFLSGDWIPVKLPERVRNFFPSAQVISLGGATEATVWSNYFIIDQIQTNWKSIPYGKPISNTCFYILDEQQRPVPIGSMGELYIGGTGVARGYTNSPEKTANAFLKDPFNPEFGELMYRTGDLGRMLPDMNMEFLGRKDNQVKIRGFRVELGEIENALSRYPDIEHAAVVAKEDNSGQKYLICFLVPRLTFTRDGVIQNLKEILPAYMIPSLWIELTELPLNINGKIDRKALLDLNISQVEDVISKPSVLLPNNEALLCTIWEEVFGIEKIGIHDNFFELGGHSLMALQIMSHYEKKTGEKIPVAALFKYPTILSLLSSLEEQKIKKNESLVALKSTGNKTPLYLIHGDGLHVLNFKALAKYVDAEQPVYALQPKDLDKIDKNIETIADIARNYIIEISEHNPDGPYAIAGYSFGGYIAIEMEKQLRLAGKEVKLLGIFDTNAENIFYNKSWTVKLPKKIIRQFPKFYWELKSLIREPSSVVKYQRHLFSRKIEELLNWLGLQKKQTQKAALPLR